MDRLQYLMPKVLQGRGGIYQAMSKLASEHGAVDLAQGMSKIQMDGTAAILDQAAVALKNGTQNYIDPNGLKSLREALVANSAARYGVQLDPNLDVTVTAGAQDALGAAMLGLLSPGDEVVFIEPFYNPVVPLARLTGATLRFVSLLQECEGTNENPTQDTAFRLDEDALCEQMSERTKLIVYSSPNSPSGHVFTRDELAILARACETFDAYLIADEVYEHLIYDDKRHVSALSVPELADRAVVISSISKTYGLTGWRVGWAQGAAPLVAGIRKLHELMSFCLPNFVSEGARFALTKLPAEYLSSLKHTHQTKRDYLCDNLADLGIRVNKPSGTFFCFIDISELDSSDDLDFCLRMPQEIGVAGVPMSLSWNQRRRGKNLVRLCFSRPDDQLQRSVHAITKWMQSR